MKNLTAKKNITNGCELTEAPSVLWAIDPTENDVLPDTSALRMLMHCVEDAPARLTPVYVLNASPGTDAIPARVTAALKLAREYVDRSEVVCATVPEVAVTSSAQRSEGVSRVIQIAEKSKATLIAVSSHGRSGPSRWWLGSFAEKLVEESPVPVLFLTHKKEAGRRGENTALFATDFSERSHTAFREFLKLAKQSRFKVTLFYEIAVPAVAAMDAGAAGAAVLPPTYFEEQKVWATGQATTWLREARESGVVCEFEVDEEALRIAESILSAANRHKATLLALCSNSGQLSRALLGSVAYEIFRSNTFPVWLYGPKAE